MTRRYLVCVFLAAGILWWGGIFGLMALADACAEYGGAWCVISPNGDGWTNPHG